MDEDEELPLPPQPRRVMGSYKLADFFFHRTLGTGSFGRVHLVRSKHNLRFYAVKVLNKEKVVRMRQVDHTNNEQRLLLAVQYPFIVNLWGTFQDFTNLYMVMDFVAGGELFTLLRRSNRFPDPVAKFYAAEVSLALNHLHKHDIVYRDLKPENILLSIDGHVKIADFGFAKFCPNTTWTLCGTPDYLAPEIINQQRYNKSVDWYALGVLVFEMLTGLPPFHIPGEAAGSPMGLYQRIQRGIPAIRWPVASSQMPASAPPGYPFINPPARDLILRFLESDPSKRLGNLKKGSIDVFNHRWFAEVDWDRLERREVMAPYMPKVMGEGDASAFEQYPDEDVLQSYGSYGGDVKDSMKELFPDFEYTAP